MQDEVRVKETAWSGELKKVLEERTGRKDIEVTVTPYCSYDVLVSAGADKHPIINFYAAIQGDTPRVAVALDYATDMLRNWELSHIQHFKAKQDCLPLYEKLKAEFPDMVLNYSTLDFDHHAVQVEIVGGKAVAYFDLWVKMDDHDMKRLIFLIRDMEATLRKDGGTCASVSYSWK